MRVVTISKKLTRGDDLVVIPRKEYEALLRLRSADEFTPTLAQKKALRVAELSLGRRKTLKYNELVRKLGFRN